MIIVVMNTVTIMRKVIEKWCMAGPCDFFFSFSSPKRSGDRLKFILFRAQLKSSYEALETEQGWLMLRETDRGAILRPNVLAFEFFLQN